LDGTEKIYLGCRNEERAKAAQRDSEASTGRTIFEIVLIDVSDPEFLEKKASVERTLASLDLDEIPVLTVFNKADRLEEGEAWAIAAHHEGVAISAAENAGLEALIKAAAEQLGQVLAAEHGPTVPNPQKG
jgi:50S ribosomal subunit-associated GTPase HflX